MGTLSSIWCVLAGPLRRARGGIAALNLRAPPARRQILGRLLLGRIADGDVVHHFDGPAVLGQPGRRAFVLQYIGLALDSGHAALYMYLKMVR